MYVCQNKQNKIWWIVIFRIIKVGVSVIPSEGKKTYHRREQEVCLLLELSAPAEQAFSENNENKKFIIREVENSFKGQVHSSVYAHQLNYFFPIYY